LTLILLKKSLNFIEDYDETLEIIFLFFYQFIKKILVFMWKKGMFFNLKQFKLPLYEKKFVRSL